MSGFVKGFLARKYPLTLFNKKLIYILKKTSHCNIALLSTTYRRFACNIRVTFVTLLCYQWLRRVELLSLLVSELSGRCPNKKRLAEASLVEHCGAMYCLAITGVAYTQQNFRAPARKKTQKKGHPRAALVECYVISRMFWRNL